MKELYATLDGLGKHQEGIERRLARRHLGSGTLVLYDVTSSYRTARWHAAATVATVRKALQIVFGLICPGLPVAVEVFEGLRRSGDAVGPARQAEAAFWAGVEWFWSATGG